MTQDLPNCRATGIGSTPHTDPATAVDFVLETFSDIPHWPQLPRRVFRENMYVQYSEHVPGVLIDDEEERIQEVARMLAGENLTSVTIEHAREMLQSV